MQPHLEQDIDPSNRTQDAHEVCFDIVNLSASVLQFTDFSPEREFARKNGDVKKIPNFPPREIFIPPRHMATIPDANYNGRSTDGKTVTECFKFFGPDRPTRKTKRRISRRVLITTVMAPTWGAVPITDLALAQVELVKQGKKK